MKGQNFLFIILLILIGLLTGTTTFFYSKSTNLEKILKKTPSPLEAPLTIPSPVPSPIPSPLFSPPPIEVGAKVSNPSQSYKIALGDTLYSIGSKFKIDWLDLAQVNGIKNPDAVVAGEVIAIPEIDPTTKKIQISFQVNQTQAKEAQSRVEKGQESWRVDPIEVSKKDAPPFFGITGTESFFQVEKNEEKGEAKIKVQLEGKEYLIKLTQPVEKGKNGIWAILAISS